jgi:signal transduction histidine kinase/ligand-binding sensor domain-containing protein
MKAQIEQICSSVFLRDKTKHLTTLVVRCFTLIWLSIFGFFHQAIGQNPGLINYSIREGLPSTEIYNIFQDSHGFIWFASDHGVAKFDGYEMKVLTVKDGLSDPVVFAFSEDDQQRIWFRTYSGKLSIYEHGKITTFKWNDQLEELLQNNLMYSLHYEDGDVYFGTEKYLGKIRADGTVEKEEIKEHELNIRITKDKKLLCGLNGISTRVSKIKINGQYYPIALTDTLNHNKVVYALQDGERTLITVNSDIFSYDGVELKKVFSGRSSIISLSKDRDGFYWVGYTNDGADKITKENFLIVDHPAILSKKSITQVLHDNEGGVWFSTLEEGVFYTSNLQTKTINLKDKTRFATFNSNHLVIGDQRGYVSTYDLKNANLLWVKNFEAPIRSLFIDLKKQLWVSAGLTSIVNLESGEIKEKITGSYTGYSAQSDSLIWAVGGLRVSRFDLKGNSNYIISNSIHLKLLFDNSKLYTSGRTGLEIFDSVMHPINKPKALSNSKISSIIPLDHELIFIGTIGNGFHLMNKKTFALTSFNTNKNLIANDVYYAQKKDSLIWISTEKGLLALKYESLKGNHIQFYKTISGEFPSERINFFHVTDESIWTVSDYNIKIIPNLKQNKEVNPVFYYELIKPQTVGLNQKIEITNKNPLQLKFGFISFNNQNIYTRYRISKNDDWTETTSRMINLQSISPGDYVLDIEFSLDNENWKTGTALPFSVQPLWWNTWYFRIVAILIIFIFSILIYKRRIVRYKERNKYLGLINEQQKKLLNAEIEATERERSRIAKDLHDGIGMDLVSIKLLANQMAKKTESKDALEIQSQLQKTISEIQNIIYGLTPAGLKLFGLSYGLENYVSMVQKNHPIEINLDFRGEEVKDQQVGAMIFRIIQELVTNSIKHSQCAAIAIDINGSSTSLEINYRDNGIGFNPDNVNPGLGLSNIRSRVESLSGKINVESGATGTNYTISLPLRK